MAESSACKPLELNKLLIPNVNTWGNVQYNIPLRVSNNETRTGTSIATRFIPPIPHNMDVKVVEPLPERVSGRDMVVTQETYKTTSGEYCVKPNPNKAMERADRAINCRRIAFLTAVEKQFQGKNIVFPAMMSEMKDNYRGAAKSASVPQDVEVRPPHTEYIFDVVASGRNEATPIYDTSPGYRRLLDPYVSTYRFAHRPFTTDEQYGLAAKDHITLYTDRNVPKAKGFGPKFKEIWMPLTSTYHRGVYDRVHVKKEFKEVAACHNPVNNIKGVFVSETKKKFTSPYSRSDLASWNHGEVYDYAPMPPNPYQTNIAPFMYCSDYCHISQGTPPCIVVDQLAHKMPTHKKCVEKYIVSKDFSV